MRTQKWVSYATSTAEGLESTWEQYFRFDGGIRRWLFLLFLCILHRCNNSLMSHVCWNNKYAISKYRFKMSRRDFHLSVLRVKHRACPLVGRFLFSGSNTSNCRTENTGSENPPAHRGVLQIQWDNEPEKGCKTRRAHRDKGPLHSGKVKKRHWMKCLWSNGPEKPIVCYFKLYPWLIPTQRATSERKVKLPVLDFPLLNNMRNALYFCEKWFGRSMHWKGSLQNVITTTEWHIAAHEILGNDISKLSKGQNQH